MKSPKHIKALRDIGFCVSCGQNKSVNIIRLRYYDPKYDKGPEESGEGKPDDWRVIPLCGSCQDKQDTMDERKFWNSVGIDPYQLALNLWQVSPQVDEMGKIVVITNIFGEYSH